MPTVMELPDPGMTAEQVKTSCLRLFDNKKYSMKAATQARGYPVDTPWPLLNGMDGEFRTEGEVSTGTTSRRPVCTVHFSWKWRSGYVSGGRKDIRASFDGKILYRHYEPPAEKTGYVMVVEGDALKFTQFFYWDTEPDGGPKKGATIHITWGLFSLD
jgi:hypothetical protein